MRKVGGVIAELFASFNESGKMVKRETRVRLVVEMYAGQVPILLNVTAASTREARVRQSLFNDW